MTERLTARERVDLLFDAGTFVEDGALANALAGNLPADGVVTGQGLVEGRPALVVANDWTVKAGSWGARTVEKIVRITERALAAELPIFWFIDSAGARITDQVDLFPGRRGAGRIFANQVALSGQVPQICCLFGPSAAGGAYIPAFCDVVFMVEERASMYLGSPRMAEVVIGETVTLEEMGGARMHATVSGCGDNLVDDDREAIDDAKYYFSYLPTYWREAPPRYDGEAPAIDAGRVRRAGGGVGAVRHARRDRRSGGRRLVLRAEAGVRRRARSPGSARIDGRTVGDRGEQLRCARWRPLQRLGRQGRAVHLVLRRVQHPAALPGGRAGLHDRRPGGAAGDHPARREDDHRRGRGDRAADLGDRAQGLRRRAVRDGRTGVHARTPAWRCRRRTSR